MTVSVMVLGAIALKILFLIGMMSFLAVIFLWPINDKPTSKTQWVMYAVAVLVLLDVLFTHFINWIP